MHIQRASATDILASPMVECLCTRSVLYSTCNVHRSMPSWSRNPRQYDQTRKRLLCKESCRLKPARRAHWVILLCTMTTAVVHYLSFLKGTWCWLLLTGKYHPVQFHWIRPAIGMAANTHRTIPTELFPYGMEWCNLLLGCLGQLSNYMVYFFFFLLARDLEPKGRSSIS